MHDVLQKRVHTGLKCEEVSIGNYVLTGGELPTLVMIDAVARLIPGVLGGATSATQESFASDVLDFPHFTRPAEVRGMTVPEVLRSGNHDAIRRWRRKEALRNTYYKRPDLIQGQALGNHDREFLQDIIQDEIMHEGG